MPKKFIILGPGFMGDYDTVKECQEVGINNHNPGVLYVQLIVFQELEIRIKYLETNQNVSNFEEIP